LSVLTMALRVISCSSSLRICSKGINKLIDATWERNK
jgi:hypothetical protein